MIYFVGISNPRPYTNVRQVLRVCGDVVGTVILEWMIHTLNVSRTGNVSLTQIENNPLSAPVDETCMEYQCGIRLPLG